MSLQDELVLLNATFMEDIVTDRSDMLPIHQRESLSHWGICNQLYICITFNVISRMNVLACLLGRSPVPFVLWRSNRDLTLWVCTILPVVRYTVGTLLGPFVFPPQPSPMYIYHYSSSFLHQTFLTYELGPKNGKTHHWDWVAIILINKLKFPTIQAKLNMWYDGLTCTDSITYVMMQSSWHIYNTQG